MLSTILNKPARIKIQTLLDRGFSPNRYQTFAKTHALGAQEHHKNTEHSTPYRAHKQRYSLPHFSINQVKSAKLHSLPVILYLEENKITLHHKQVFGIMLGYFYVKAWKPLPPMTTALVKQPFNLLAQDTNAALTEKNAVKWLYCSRLQQLHLTGIITRKKDKKNTYQALTGLV
ncbi:MAG: hypothetical protein KUG83_09525 [Gammaproteobacteria bacterium]|nr:hypothetical protein [Gammaproteobacteria bacterium]